MLAFKPSNLGILISIIIKSGCVFSVYSIAFSPSPTAATTFYPSSFGLNIVSTIAENDLDGNFNITQNDTGTLAQLVFQYKGE